MSGTQNKVAELEAECKLQLESQSTEFEQIQQEMHDQAKKKAEKIKGYLSKYSIHRMKFSF